VLVDILKVGIVALNGVQQTPYRLPNPLLKVLPLVPRQRLPVRHPEIAHAVGDDVVPPLPPDSAAAALDRERPRDPLDALFDHSPVGWRRQADGGHQVRGWVKLRWFTGYTRSDVGFHSSSVSRDLGGKATAAEFVESRVPI